MTIFKIEAYVENIDDSFLAEFRRLEKCKNYKVKARINSTLSGEVKEVEFTAPVTDTEYEIAF